MKNGLLTNRKYRYLVFFLLFLSICILFIGFLHNQVEAHLHTNGSVELIFLGQSLRSSSVKKFHNLEALPKYLGSLLLFQEDQGFYSHQGYSLRDIFIVLRDYIWKGHRLRGASTVTQQLARSLFLDREETLWRKIKELYLAQILERDFSKEKILSLYFNHIYWGRGAHGIAAAGRIYFNTEPAFISLKQGIFLISILPQPSACLHLLQCTDEATVRRMYRLEKYYFNY